jgi:hypothetical protein
MQNSPRRSAIVFFLVQLAPTLVYGGGLDFDASLFDFRDVPLRECDFIVVKNQYYLAKPGRAWNARNKHVVSVCHCGIDC